MTISSILVAVDFSEPAIAALEWSVRSFAPDATVTLLHVIDPPSHSGPEGRAFTAAEPIVEAATEFAQRKLDELAKICPPNTRCFVRVGSPHETITHLAREIHADVIVIGPHGGRPRPARFLGTTADRVARTATMPVLVATHPGQTAPRVLLVPVDDTAATPALLEWTRDLMHAFGARAELLHVWSNAVYSHVASMCFADTKNEADAKRELEQEIEGSAKYWVGELAAVGAPRERIRATVTYGNAGVAALATATSTNADLILLGRRGDGLLAPALFGSTISTILHESARPVMVIPEQPH